MKIVDANTGLLIDSAVSNSDGYYNLTVPLMAGKYIVTAVSPLKKAVTTGANTGEAFIDGRDISEIERHMMGYITDVHNKYSMYIPSGDVDMSRFSNSVSDGFTGKDMQQAEQILLSKATNYFTETLEQLDIWVYSVDTIDLISDTTFMVRGVMRGDVNRNYNGNDMGSVSEMQRMAKNSRRKLELYGVIDQPENKKIISLPIVALDEAELTSFQMALPYSTAEIINFTIPFGKDVSYDYNPHYNDENIIAFVWATAKARKVHVGDTLAILTINIDGTLYNNPNKYLRNQTSFYQAAYNQKVLNFSVAVPEIYIGETEEDGGTGFGEYDTITKSETIDGKETEITIKGTSEASHIVMVVPNPATTVTDITYSVEDNSVVTLQLFDMLGRLRRTLVYAERQQGLYRRTMDVNTLAAGIYFLRLETASDKGKVQTSIERIIVQ